MRERDIKGEKGRESRDRAEKRDHLLTDREES